LSTRQEALQVEADTRQARMKGFVAEFTLSTDKDPDVCYEWAMFERKEAYPAMADHPQQDKPYRQLLQLLEGPPEWRDEAILHGNMERNVTGE
jgi:hypothetical protein